MRPPKVRVEFSREARDELLDTVGVLVARDAADRIVARAKATAPVRTGQYRAGLRAEVVTNDTTGRREVRVGSTSPHAGLVEGHTGNLARALDAGRG